MFVAYIYPTQALSEDGSISHLPICLLLLVLTMFEGYDSEYLYQILYDKEASLLEAQIVV